MAENKRVENFQKFVYELMGKVFADQMVNELVRIGFHDEKQSEVWKDWTNHNEEQKYGFVDWLVEAIDDLYSSRKYTDSHKLAIVNGTERIKIKEEAEKIKKEQFPEAEK